MRVSSPSKLARPAADANVLDDNRINTRDDADVKLAEDGKQRMK